MILDFASMAANTIPGFKGGEGEAIVRKFDDPRMGAVVRITLPQGASIGLHTHIGNCEIVYVLSGSGQCIDDGAEYPISAGVCHYCPMGHEHGMVNDGDEDLVIFTVVPEHVSQ